eukprot:TRINITY_DN16538_c0_g1_i1.p1 TRINITY_DN16538_c0_g1~~TRINITY_DN16538_c0_g1_i1.p1  ORF type:complete len:325 (+),score=108.91 TRINITY_DN16538_c0_g1_i1:70-975(+)
MGALGNDGQGAPAVAVPMFLLHAASLAVPAAAATWMMTAGLFRDTPPLFGWLPAGERLCVTAALSLAHLLCYWGANLYYALVAKVPELHKYQIPHSSRRRGNPPELLRAAVADAALSTLVIGPVITYAAFPLFAKLGVTAYGPLPSAGRCLRDLALSALFTDATFYWSHRMLHHPSVYARVHKQHHEFKATVGFASEYDHPIEDAVNTLTTIGGPLLLGSHAAVLALFVVLRLHQTVDSHSGYELPWPLSLWNMWPCATAVRRHDYHHTDNLGNYGDWLPLWDWLCGTDAHWKRSAAMAPK